MSASAHHQQKKPDDGIRCLEPDGHVGFNSLPTQYVSRAMRRGFTFNVMCVGETGLGKSTLMESLFDASFDDGVAKNHQHSQVELSTQTYDLEEDNVRLKLTICDTVGYGDQINKTDSFQAILKHIDAQYEAYLQEELKLHGRNMTDLHDTRVHVCLYFISPTGHGLKPLDLLCLKELERKVNIIPVIAKADTVTKHDLIKFKGQIMHELLEAEIHFYRFPTDEENGMASSNFNLSRCIPFAVVGSRDVCTVDGRQFKGREYPWGTVDIENEEHCDFVKLRELLIRNNMEDLRERTDCKYYELYRQERLIALGFISETCGDGELLSYKQMLHNKQTQQDAEFHANEQRMRQQFMQLVKAKDIELSERERAICEEVQRLKDEHSAAVRDLEKAHHLLDVEYNEFHNYKEQYTAASLKQSPVPMSARSSSSVYSSGRSPSTSLPRKARK